MTCPSSPTSSFTGAHFVLGADDSEMRAVAALIDLLAGEGHPLSYSCGERYTDPRTDAVLVHSRRIAPGEQAQMFYLEPEHADREIVTVEVVEPAFLDRLAPVVVIDHHGAHPAAALPPAEFLRASSIGQVVAYLAVRGIAPKGWIYPDDSMVDVAGTFFCTFSAQRYWVSCDGSWRELPSELVWEAAADHCLGAACQGQCPGADFSRSIPAYRWLLSNKRATYAPTLSDAEFAAVIATAEESVRSAPPVSDLPGDVADLRMLPVDGPVVVATGEQYPVKAQFLPLVGSLVGRAYMVHIKRGDGALALRMGGGDGSPASKVTFEAFGVDPGRFGCYPATEPRPNNAYCDPCRGLAGGTISMLAMCKMIGAAHSFAPLIAEVLSAPMPEGGRFSPVQPEGKVLDRVTSSDDEVWVRFAPATHITAPGPGEHGLGVQGPVWHRIWRSKAIVMRELEEDMKGTGYEVVDG